MNGEKVSRNFWRHEFACKCGCGFDAVDVELLTVLEETRLYFQARYIGENVKIEITSGCRCAAHNRAEGGVPGSMHIRGKATDFKVWIAWQVKQVPADEVAEYLERTYPDRFGIGRYDNRTHVDVRQARARWDKRTGHHGV
ncbi:D-Ala-D-Ala carboxypeptidase family metallohydrolase [Desulfatitalea tepidiphila]|uniref:D-Ala-D-Ala carboxypeptidase family metallohydrolase n=1 Tax=Desulfatitalea tepidiphila TaxID=1185843 RepID=UPI0006B56E02|nr:D-Ala-D-Ala carboxypeptidase family metallohydrolase [Desulfatitalea tepidiphila]